MKKMIFVLSSTLVYLAVFSCKNAEDTEYVDRVVEKEKIVEVEKPVTDTSGKDTTPPANVTDLEALNRGGAIQLTWTDATDSDTFGYEISYGEKAFAVILQGIATCYVPNLVNGTQYSFTVKSMDKSGNKSEGVSVSGTPTAGSLSVTISIPSDPSYPAVSTNPTLSNTSANVNVTFTATSSVEKAVWKIGTKGVGVKPNVLLADSSTHLITGTSFTVTESGFYDVVAIDTEGHTAWEQVEVKTIDKTAPGEIQLPLADFDESAGSANPVRITWIDPLPESKYDSRVDHYLISYTINDGMDVTNVASVNSGVQTLNLAVPSGYESGACLYVTFKSVDALGNVSEGKTVQAWTFSNTVNVTAENVASTLENLSSSSKLVLTGEITDETVSSIRSTLRNLYQTNENINVSLDMSNTTGITEILLANCDNLVAIKLPEGIDTLSVWAFNKCSKLSSVSLPSTLTTINQHAFRECKSLKNIQIPSSVTKIAFRAFNESGVTEIVIPESVTDMGTTTFMNCTNLQSAKILGNISVLNYYIFADCGNLTEVELPNSITEFVGSNIFNHCYRLETITFKGTVSEWNNISKVDNWYAYTGIKRIVCTDGTITL